MHAIPTVGLAFMNDPVRSIATTLDSPTPVPVEVVLNLMQVKRHFFPRKILGIPDPPHNNHAR
jgi:hypothetical protein